MPRFDIGKFVMTKGVASEIDNNPNYKMELLDCLTRYLNCEWGNLCDTDKLLNEDAIKNDERILARYNTSCGDIYIITERDRSYTNMLYVGEY